MSLKVKICGITELEDARFCAVGAHFMGFIQYQDSPRYITPENAAKINEWIHGPEPVGVFVNEPAEKVNEICEKAGFTYAQLHGNESPETCEAVNLPVIKAIRVVHDASAEQLRAMMDSYRDVVDYFLLDTHDSDLWGGTGESFNWRLARDLSNDYSIFLAGGISADNVEEAVDTMRPYAIDVSSSLESAPGKKDFDKIEQFFATVRNLSLN